MQRIFLTLATAVVLFCLITLSHPSSMHAQTAAPKTYTTNCVLCHAADGSGSSPSGKALKAKDLGSKEVQAKSDEDLAEVITKGKGKMPAFGNKLKPEQIKELAAYIRTLKKT